MTAPAAMSDLEAQRAARRAAMPTVTAWMAQYAEFAPRVIYAQENGITVGKPPQYAEVFNIPPGYGMSTAKGKK